MSEAPSADTLTDLGIYSINLRQDYAEAPDIFVGRSIKASFPHARPFFSSQDITRLDRTALCHFPLLICPPRKRLG